MDPLPLVNLDLVLRQLVAGVEQHVAEVAGQGVLVAPSSPVQHHHELARKAALGTSRSRSQQLGATMLLLHVLLEAVLDAEGDVARGAADLPARPHPRRVSVMQHPGGTDGAMDHHHVLRKARLPQKLLTTVVALS